MCIRDRYMGIESGKRISVEDMKRIQLDVKDSFVDRVWSDFILILETMIERHVPKTLPTRARIDTLVDILRRFDAVFAVDSAAAAIYSTWEYSFRERLLVRAFGLEDENRVPIADNIAFEQLIFRRIHKWADALRENESAKIHESWCEAIKDDLVDGMVFTEEDGCGLLFALSLVRADQELARTFNGRSPASYSWGELHPCRLLHTPLSQTFLDYVFGMRYPCPGNTRTVNVAAHFMRNGNYEARHGPNYRSVIDMDDSAQSFFIIDTGQSENLFSKHYRDLNELHRRGELVPMRSPAEALRADVAESILDIHFEVPTDKPDEL
eukprot:TRINITY_DN1221_c0_g1_i4.p1 TRINITY_DN1221_c0_g1~~TRINITY_DN1221_c0_g1_i4.p1  ORF type:complete len:324 (+),score=67.50 TRINITY_DN1221_c0_g1_i4:64-1035(+)